ncbi:hypothetical protein A3F27_00045 [Candidatus Kaiserbacteria bacterium RIFCSPHIGHO2_12_FULL_53_13]|uniref:EamA domain-containing protein n=1 Tax=Candidatus Kaiserbacteria bacterium RIFCSPHIGHO2_12_FULL_53_13 TaxID=1798502 RepID=A0A1F6EDF5_9BACT|nr:MAG: hypothetical protein A3F27_00045 [Candidatus Kaiserbacteria bacterium RIFCSPHIGHO2_12_FULL_53_13]OGG74284.1 MAG: hypothetical protein A3A37_03110 [Candidatus Kaiserbacteria bacterium RIFCSPLOWO2_01_FULL_52_36]
MKDMSETRKGELLIFLGAVLWSFFPIITVLTYSTLPSLISLAWSTLLATLFFAGVMTYRRKWHELRDIQLWKYSLLVAFFIGILYYSFIFVGLESTTPGNMAIIALFEVFTSFLLFNVFGKEAISFEHKVGAALMVMGAAIVLMRDFSGINVGDVLILVAVCCSPFGNLFQQRARTIASSEAIMFLRSMFSTPALFLLAYALGARVSLADARASLLFLLINGVLLLGLSKLFWIEAIHRISVTKGVALSSVNPFLTLLLAWLILHQAPAMWQIAGLIPLVAGVLFLTGQLKFRAN